MPVSKQYRKDAPTTASATSSQGYPIKSGDKAKLRAAIRLFNMHKDKYSAEKRARIKAHILSAARKAGVKVSLSVVDTGRTRRFTEALHERGHGGKFAPKANSNGTPPKKRQTAQEILEALPVGDAWSIPGIEGSIKKTEDGYLVTGPEGFQAKASNVTEAISVAARLVRNKMRKGKK